MNTFRSIKIWMTLVVLLGVASTTQAATINLAWNPNTETNLAGYSVSYGTQSGASTTTIDVGNNASPLLTNLVNGTRYYFTVKAYNTSAMYSAPSAEISGMAVDVPPTSPAAPAPASGATGVALTGTLSWAASTYATQYDVAFGTTNPPPVVSSNQTSTTYQSNWLVPGTTYYWQIVAKGPGGSTSGAIWSFATGANASRPLPVAAYSFNEGTGTATNDASGNGRTGALTNATWTSTGKNGGALSFNGSSSRVTVADSAALRLSTAMTLEAWINPSGAGAPDWQAIIYKGLDNYALATIGANLPTAAAMIGGGLAMATSANTVPFNTWTHLATTYDGATVRLFVNGTQVASRPATGVFDVSTNPLEIGGSLVDLGAFAGLIDDVRVYNTPLTLAQIQTDMTTPVATASDTQAPTAPTTLTVSAVSTTQLALTWAASTDNVGVTGYRIERCAGAGCTTFSQVGTATAASYSDAGLVASTSYTYRVRATDAANNLGSYSSAASAATLTPTPAPAVPAGPTPVSSATGIPMTVALSWAASANATQYDVAFGTTTPPAVVSSNRTTTSYQPLALTAGTTYYWQIVAKGAGGSTSGPVWNFTMLPAPTAPAGPTPTISATSVPLTVALSWAASANTTQYDVAFGTTNPPTIISSNQTATTYQPAALTAGTQYYWQVVAKGACGTTSGPVWSFTTLSVPAAPAGPTPASSA
ncbi:MAG: LamG-like jellyroll fold domain-containing protein, partial [Acidobacteriota bacterium]